MCAHVCVCVDVNVYVYVCMHVCMHGMYVCIHICLRVCLYIYISLLSYLHIYIDVCVYASNTYIYIHKCIIHTYRHGYMTCHPLDEFGMLEVMPTSAYQQTSESSGTKESNNPQQLHNEEHHI